MSLAVGRRRTRSRRFCTLGAQQPARQRVGEGVAERSRTMRGAACTTWRRAACRLRLQVVCNTLRQHVAHPSRRARARRGRGSTRGARAPGRRFVRLGSPMCPPRTQAVHPSPATVCSSGPLRSAFVSSGHRHRVAAHLGQELWSPASARQQPQRGDGVDLVASSARSSCLRAWLTGSR